MYAEEEELLVAHEQVNINMDAGSGSANLQPRGRGRGRGMLSVRAGVAPKPGPQESKEKTVKEMVKQLQMNNIQATVDFLTRPRTQEGQLQEILDETVDVVCNSVIDNIEFSEVGTELLRHLWDIDLPGGISIRKPLLTRIQALFKARDNLTDSEFLGYSSLLCDLFGCLTINSLPLNALVGPVYAILQDLLCKRGSSQDNMLTFHMLLRKHGPLLQKQDEVRKGSNFYERRTFGGKFQKL